MSLEKYKVSDKIIQIGNLPSFKGYKDKIDIILSVANFTDTCEPSLDNNITLNQDSSEIGTLKADIQELCTAFLEIPKQDGTSVIEKINNTKTQIDSIMENGLIKKYIESEEKRKETELVLGEIKKLKFKENGSGEYYITAFLSDGTRVTLYKRHLHGTKISELKTRFAGITLNQENKEKWWKYVKDIKIQRNKYKTKPGLLSITFDFLIDKK